MIGKTFETDKKAQAILNDNLPKKWLIREQHPDVYIDYFIELVEEGEPTGILFAVQLKGTTTIKTTKEAFSFKMETKHLRYYLNKVKQPVFLIVINVENKEGYWVFIQRYLKENVNYKTLESQKNLTIGIEKKNCLEKIEILEKEIRTADIYMRDLWPSSLEASIKAKEREWREIDPRFGVKLTYEKEKIKVDFYPKEKIDFKFSAKGEKALELQKKMENLFNRGIPATFQTRDLEIEGSELIRRLHSDAQTGEIKLEAPKIDASVILKVTDDKGILKAIVSDIEGVLFLGKKEYTFKGKYKKSPLELVIRTTTEILNKRGFIDISIDFNIEEWFGKPVLFLSGFTNIYSLFEELNFGHLIAVSLEIDGNPLFATNAKKFEEQGYVKSWINYLTTVKKSREIAERTKKDLLFPKREAFEKEEIENINFLHDIIFTDQHCKIDNGSIINAKIIPNNSFKDEYKKRPNRIRSIKLVTERATFRIFDQDIDFGPLEHEFTEMELISKVKPEKIDHAIKSKKPIPIKLRGIKGSKVIIRQV